MRSLVLILEGLREVLFHTDDAVEVTAPLTDDGTASRDVTCSGMTIGFRVCSAECLILDIEDVRRMLLAGIGERIAEVTLTFSPIANLVVAISGVAERIMEPVGAP